MSLTTGIYKTVAVFVLLAFLIGMPWGQSHAKSAVCSGELSVISGIDCSDDSISVEKIDFNKKLPAENIVDTCHCALHCCAIKLPATNITINLSQPVVRQVLMPSNDKLLISFKASRLERPPRT